MRHQKTPIAVGAKTSRVSYLVLPAMTTVMFSASAVLSATSVQPVSVSLADPINSAPVATNASSVKELKALKAAYDAKNYDLCVKGVGRAIQRAKSLEPWILVYELECADKLPANEANADGVKGRLRWLEEHLNWLFLVL